MAQIFVSPRFSTLIKFDAHPEPGLIGDQDAFKVEYMRNMVAVKPLVSKGKTNLFLFTKEGQFNFQLIATPDHHDNIVHAQRRYAPLPPTPVERRIALVDELLTRKIGKAARGKDLTLRIETVAMPKSRSTLVIRFQIETTMEKSFRREQIILRQSRRPIQVENLYLERVKVTSGGEIIKGLLLLRAEPLIKKLPLEFCLLPSKSGASEITLTFNADL